MKIIPFIILFFSINAMSVTRSLPTVSNVEVSKYLGKWYAISSLPQFFTRKCLSQTAEYGLINEQTISVLNVCIKNRKSSHIRGQAVIVNAATNAELEVTFNSFFTRLFRVKGDYNIIKLDKNYEFVMVGSRNRKSLWIMSRTPSMPEDILDSYINSAEELGFPISKLVKSQF